MSLLRVHSAILTALAALTLAAARARADVFVVAPSGAPFTQIQAAVDVANDGDVILVKTGTYASFAARNVDLSIIADAGHVVQIDGGIRVGALSAARTLLLSGLRATGTNSLTALARHGLYAHDAHGLILVQDCELRGANFVVSAPCQLAGSGARFERCDAVVFTHCNVFGGGPAPSGAQSYGDGGTALLTTQTSLALHDCTLRGANAGLEILCAYGYGYGDGGRGGDGLVRSLPQPGFEFGARCTIRGGNGADAFDPMNCFCLRGGSGGDAVEGVNGTPSAWPQSSWFGGGFGIGTCSLGCFGQFGFPASGMNFGGTARIVSGLSTRIAREHNSMTVTFEGLNGDRIELVRIEQPAFVPTSALQGVRNFSLRHPQAVLQLGTITSGNSLLANWSVPELGPGVEGLRVLYQPLHIASSGPAKLGHPFAIVLVDSAF